MKLISFEWRGQKQAGIIRDDTVTPIGDDLLTIRAIEIEVPENAELVRVLACRLDGQRVARFAVRARRMDHRAVHAGRGHLGQGFVGRVGRSLAMVRAHREVFPDVDLRVDDQHSSSRRRPR